ncbi:uncharacterized protein METZ01_LOCUS452900 [marine metagenome]|uniref:Putative auto-transporter adhesin head GIN domain-containing protein n=1 Tax=marine metagenome TaxID=408172 RepID=A0A382ZWK4_9ZZZZ
MRLIVRLVLVIMTLLLALFCFQLDRIEGSGNIISENRRLTHFNSIKVLGSIDVNINYSDDYGCTVVGDDNLIPYIKTEVINNKLKISINKSYSTSKGLMVNVNALDYDNISISGSGDIHITDFNNNNLSLNIDGSGNITGNGEVQTLSTIINGSGDIMLRDLKSISTIITINGSGDAKIWASESISANINGSGKIEYYGNPMKIESKVNGSGKISSN